MKLSEISAKIGGTLHGDDVEIRHVGGLDINAAHAIVYIEKPRNLERALASQPAALIIGRGIDPGTIPYVQVDDPKFAYIQVLRMFSSRRTIVPKRSSHAIIEEGANIGSDVTVMAGAVIMKGASIEDRCIIYPNCVIEHDVIVGADSIIYPGVTIKECCVIGRECIIHPGTVIGADGYGFYEKDGTIHKIPHIGNVVIGDRVEIGANCCIDRGTVGSTKIGNDTKFDNMVHVAHNVKIGERCYIVAQVGISGSVIIGNHVTIAGQAGIVDHITIPDETIIMGQSGIIKDVEKAEIIFGTPARPIREQHRINASLGHLPDLLKRVKKLEERLHESEANS